MKQVDTLPDVYPAVEELIVILGLQGKTALSSKLDHRMHRVSWTSGSELLDELGKVLQDAILNMVAVDSDTVAQMERIVKVINSSNLGLVDELRRTETRDKSN